MKKRFAVKGVSAGTPLRDAAPAILLANALPLFELEDAARGGADMDSVHDMRVASRRLREAMRLFARVYPNRGFKTWYRQVRSITRALGPVRDSDVFIDAFSRITPSLSAEGGRCVTFLVGFRMGQRIAELDHLNRELSELDLAKNLKGFHEMMNAVQDAPEAEKPLSSFAHGEVAERAATVFGAQPAALDEENVDEQHALRIDYKRLRYAVEAFAPCYGDAFDGLHTVLTAFQDALGDLHDVHVFLSMLHEPARIEAAHRAGVSSEGVDEVVRLLNARAHAEFTRFAELAADHPAERLLSALLLPLAEKPGDDVAQSESLVVAPGEWEAEWVADFSVDSDDVPWSLEWRDGIPVALLDADSHE